MALEAECGVTLGHAVPCQAVQHHDRRATDTEVSHVDSTSQSSRSRALALLVSGDPPSKVQEVYEPGLITVGSPA